MNINIYYVLKRVFKNNKSCNPTTLAYFKLFYLAEHLMSFFILSCIFTASGSFTQDQWTPCGVGWCRMLRLLLKLCSIDNGHAWLLSGLKLGFIVLSLASLVVIGLWLGLVTFGWFSFVLFPLFQKGYVLLSLLLNFCQHWLKFWDRWLF